jgi:hypothetical protein
MHWQEFLFAGFKKQPNICEEANNKVKSSKRDIASFDLSNYLLHNLNRIYGKRKVRK